MSDMTCPAGCGGELNPCPFCGAPAAITVDSDHHGLFYTLGCSRRGCIAHDLMMDVPADEVPVEEGIRKWTARVPTVREVRDPLADQKAIARQRIEALKDHCRTVNPTWAWLMREVLEIVDPQSPESAQS